MTDAASLDPGLYPSLAERLVASFATSDRSKAVLPDGLRVSLLDALAPMMVDIDRLDRYLAALLAQRKARAVDLALLDLPMPEIPVDDVATRGLATLGDDHLAELAVRPEALRCLFDYISERMDDGSVGLVWWDVFTRTAADDARAAGDPGDDLRKMVERLKNLDRIMDAADAVAFKAAAKPGNEPAVVPPARIKLLTPRRVGYWIGLAAAACLLLAAGVLLGSRAFRGGGNFLVAAAVVPFEGARGQAIPRLEVTSDRTGFVTVIALLPGEADRPVVFPVSPSPDLEAGPGSPADTGPFPEEARPARAVLVVVTETPAADTIDKALLDARFSSDQIARLESVVADLLGKKGHERFAIDRVAIGRSGP